MPIFTTEEFMNELKAIKAEVLKTRELTRFRYLGRELSLHEFAEIVGHDQRTIIKELIKPGLLKARKIKCKRATSGFTYKILESEAMRFLRENHRLQNEKKQSLSPTSIRIQQIIDDIHNKKETG